MRIAVLWAGLSGYMNTCIKALACIDEVELFVANSRVIEVAPFDEAHYSWMETRYQWENTVDARELIFKLESFKPDLILVSGWDNPGYRKILKHFSGKAIRVIGMDNQWRATPKQWAGVIASHYYLHSICDVLYVPGERQAVFAKKLGFTQERIWRGLYSCDHDSFSKIYFERKNVIAEPKSFVFVGRFEREKGIGTLVEAYRSYRKHSADPWLLKCYGSGSLQCLLVGIDGVEIKGFRQPDELPKELASASCLILPSSYEPWGVVVHEAAAAGMSVIASNSVGATVHLVQDSYNGYIVQSGNADGLSQAMLRYSSLSRDGRSIMGENSYKMSLQFTPKRWADTLVNKTKELAAKRTDKKDCKGSC